MNKLILFLLLIPMAPRAAVSTAGIGQNIGRAALLGVPKVLFQATQVNGLSSSMETLVAGGGSVVWQSTTSSAILGVGTASGDRAVRQAHGYIMCQPGRAQTIHTTGVFGSRQNGTVKRVGYFDDYNGLFFEISGTGTFVVIRSSIGASVVDLKYPRSSWNLDTLDGTGPSGLVVDFTKLQLFVIDMNGMGGRVRFGFELNGCVVYVHETAHTNQQSDVFIASRNLPVRFEIVNTSTVAVPSVLKLINAVVLSEGSDAEDKGLLFSTSTKNTTVGATTTGNAVVVIRPSLTFSGATNRVFILPQSFDIMAAGNIFYQVVAAGSYTGGAWAQVPGSAVEVNQGATYTANTGRGLMSGFVGGASTTRGMVSAGLPPISSRFALDAAGTTPDTLGLIVYSFSGTEATSAAVEWLERR